MVSPGGGFPEGVRLPADQLASEPVHLLLHPLHLRVEPALDVVELGVHHRELSHLNRNSTVGFSVTISVHIICIDSRL